MSSPAALNRANVENELYRQFQEIDAENPNCKPTFASISSVWKECDALEATKGWIQFAQTLVAEEQDSKVIPELDGIDVSRETALRFSLNILQIMMGTYFKATAVLPAAEKVQFSVIIAELKDLSAIAWVELGVELSRKKSPSEEILVFSPFILPASDAVIVRQKVAESMCYKACIESNAGYWAAWLNLGSILQTHGPDTEITISEILPVSGEPRAPKTQLYAYHCFDRAAKLNPTHPLPLVNMAMSLDSSPATANLSNDEKRHLKCELALKALALDSSCDSAWYNLGKALECVNDTETAEVPGVGPVTYPQAFIKCIEGNIAHGSNNAEEEACSWVSLGLLERDIIVNGKTYNERECYLRALSLFDLSGAWVNLLGCFHEGEETIDITLADGTTTKMSRFEVAKRAAFENTELGSAWLNLGLLFNDIRNAEIEANVNPLTSVIFDVEGTIIEFSTPQKVFLRALEAQHNNWKIWVNLGRTIPDDATNGDNGAVVLKDGTVLTRQICAEQALKYKPSV